MVHATIYNCSCKSVVGTYICPCQKNVNGRPTMNQPSVGVFNEALSSVQNETLDYDNITEPPSFALDFGSDYEGDEDEEGDDDDHNSTLEESKIKENSNSENLENFKRLCRFYPTFCTIFLELSKNNVKSLENVLKNDF